MVLRRRGLARQGLGSCGDGAMVVGADAEAGEGGERAAPAAAVGAVAAEMVGDHGGGRRGGG